MLWLLALETVALAGFVLAQTRGMLTWGGRLVAQLGVEHGHAEALGRIDDVLARFYQTAPWRVVLSIAFHLVAWLLGSLEAWLILKFLGVPVSLTTATVIESFGTAIRFATFLIPASLGALEGGYVVTFAALGLGSTTAVSFSLVRRVREAVWVGLGLLVFALARPAARRLAESLDRAGFEARPTSMRARLRFPGHVVTFTRNWSQILVNETPVVLDAPVRVRRGVWLVPESFVGRVLPRLTAGVTVAAAPAAPRAPVPEVALEELRFRSYPSFTRIVVETSGPLAYRVEAQGAKEARIRLIGLAAGAQVEEIRDGFVGEVRVERAGGDALLRVVFEGVAGTARASTLADPHRLVLDFTRPTETGPQQEEVTPLRTLVLDAGHGGHDSGAVGPTGLLEKELVLDVTRRAAKLAEERLGVKVLLTRDADAFVALRDRTSFANRGVKQAAFYVLGGAGMPAILIEVGFVTNPKEERRLKDARHRDEIARAIVAGLAEYKRNWDQRVRAAGEPALTKAR